MGNVRVTENEHTLQPSVESLGRPTPLRRRALVPDDDDAEARSYGRQHGSSQGLNMLAASARAEEAQARGRSDSTFGLLDSTFGATPTTNDDPATPKAGTPQKENVAWSAYLASDAGDVSPTRVKEGGFRFSVDGSRPTDSALAQSRGATHSTENVKLAYSWNPGTVLGGGGSEKPSVHATSRRVPIAYRGESLHGTQGELARALTKVVVVHPQHEEEDECCEMSAGRTQRGSFSSLLLLEAQELFDTMETMDTMENSPEDEVIESADRVAVAATN